MRCQVCTEDNVFAGTQCPRCTAVIGRTPCPSCAAGLHGFERFCPACGLQIKAGAGTADAAAAMAKLHASIELLSKYLPERAAGRILAAEGGTLAEKRYAAVLFADVSGFTAMSEAMEPERVREMMNRVFEQLVTCVHRYDGTTDKFLGDCIMAVFGAPVSHDNDPERAVRASMDMIAVLREQSERTGQNLRLSVGVNAGPLVAGSVGAPDRLDYTVMGDTVNLAQRLEAAARPGQVLVSREVYRRSKDAIRYKALPPVSVKGKRNPVEVFEAKEIRTRHESEGADEAFVGRESESQTWEQALGAGAGGLSGQLWVVDGDEGVGKSALVRRWARLAVGKGLRVVRTAASAYGGEPGPGLFADVVAQLLRVDARRGGAAIKDGHQKLVELGLAPHEAALLLSGFSREKLAAANLDYGTTLRAQSRAFYRLLSASQNGTVIFFEDLQFADPTTRALLADLAVLEPPASCVVVLVQRPPALAITDAPWVQRMSVAALSREEVHALVSGKLNLAVLDDKITARITELTAGNARLIEELLQVWTDQGLVFRAKKGWLISAKVLDTEIPSSLQGLIAARFDQLDVESRRFCQAAAAVGTSFEPEMVRRISGLQVDLESVCTQLLDRKILLRDHTGAGSMRFAHAAYREAALATLVSTERGLLHYRIAQVLEEFTDQKDPLGLQTLAFHLAESPDAEKASKFLLRAGKRMLDTNQIDNAVKCFERLSTLAAPQGYSNYFLSRAETELEEALYHLGGLYGRLGRLDDAEDRLQWAYARAKHFFNGDVRVWSQLALAKLYRTRGQHEESAKALAGAQEDSAAMRDPGLETVALLEQARLLNAQNRYEEAKQALAQAIKIEPTLTQEQRDPLPQRIHQGLLFLEVGHALGGSGSLDDALRAYSKAHADSEAAQDPDARAQVCSAISKALAAKGDPDRAQPYQGEAIKLFRELGDRIGEAKCLHNYALVEIQRGALDNAWKAIRGAERIFDDIGWREGIALCAQAREAFEAARAQRPAVAR